jgi:hypothetical protein
MVKEYQIDTYYNGIKFQLLVTTTSKEKARKLFKVSLNEINSFAFYYKPKTQECIDNLEVVYGKFKYSGELSYFMDEEFIAPLTEFQKLIDKHREYCKNYHETIKYYNNKGVYIL